MDLEIWSGGILIFTSLFSLSSRMELNNGEKECIKDFESSRIHVGNLFQIEE